MKNETDVTTKTESHIALGSDWVDAHADYLFNFAIGQVRDASTAEDLVQDTFLAAVKAQTSFGGKSSARTWLVGILRHKIYDHLRKTCRERAVRDDPTPMNDGESWEESALWLHDVSCKCLRSAFHPNLLGYIFSHFIFPTILSPYVRCAT